MNMEWSKAQEISFSANLVEAAKQHLQFLAAVDSAGCLYDGPTLDRAINRYKYYWLPFLAKHMECSTLEGALVVPLDCEWIWHCHRLNPLQYKRDCEEIFGRILDKKNVSSTVGGNCSKPTESIWNKIYVSEPFHLDLDNVTSHTSSDALDVKTQKSTEYDLVAAVKRQSSFFSKISKVIGYDDRFLEEAVVRYKSFLHLSKMIMERNVDPFCVPTHDIDLIWHTHQLYPAAYCKDLTKIFGKVLDHNDRDSGSSGSGKNNLQNMFSKTKHLWENTYDCMYCMHEARPNKGKDGLAQCLMDHVPRLGITETKSKSAGNCFITCSLVSGDKNHAKCNKTQSESAGGCFITCSLMSDGKNHAKCSKTQSESAGDCFITCSLMSDGKNHDKRSKTQSESAGGCFITCSLMSDGKNHAKCSKTQSESAGDCFITCSLMSDGKNYAKCNKTQLESAGGCFITCSLMSDGKNHAIS